MNDWQQQQDLRRQHELREQERHRLQQQEQDRRYRLEIDREEQIRRIDIEQKQHNDRTWTLTNWLRRLGQLGSRSNRRR